MSQRALSRANASHATGLLSLDYYHRMIGAALQGVSLFLVVGAEAELTPMPKLE